MTDVFTFDMDDAEIQSGVYPLIIRNAILHVNEEKGSKSMRLDLEFGDSPYKGEKFRHFIWLNPQHRMSVKMVRDFISAVTGQPAEGSVNLTTEEGPDGTIIFPDFVDEEVYGYVKVEDGFTKVSHFVSEPPAEDAPF